MASLGLRLPLGSSVVLILASLAFLQAEQHGHADGDHHHVHHNHEEHESGHGKHDHHEHSEHDHHHEVHHKHEEHESGHGKHDHHEHSEHDHHHEEHHHTEHGEHRHDGESHGDHHDHELGKDAHHHGAHAHVTHDDHHEHQHEHDRREHHHHRDQKKTHHDGHGHAATSSQQGWFYAYLSAAAMSAISLVGVVFLAIFGIVPRIEATVEYVCLAFAGSVLVADALLHLLPHALEGADHSAMTTTGLAAVVGSLGILAVPEIVSENHGHSHGADHAHEQQVKPYGIANLVVEMLHNFVDGISIGLSWMAGTPAGLSATLAVAVHELPQELGDFVVLRAAGFSTPRLLAWNFAASLTCIGGVGVAHFIGQDASLPLQRFLMAFTAGSFLTLSLNMIFPQVSESIQKRHKGSGAVYAKLVCLIVSVLAVVILMKVGELEGGHGHDHDHGHSHGHGHEGHGHEHGASHRVEM